MKDLTQDIGTLYLPQAALVIYEQQNGKEKYVEYFDMDENGCPVNAHPLTVKEAQDFARSLDTQKEKRSFLKPRGIITASILHIDPSQNGLVIWHTKSCQRRLFFVDGLEIPSGDAFVPAMLWVATSRNLSVFALKSDRRPNENTALFHAPFFNVYAKGNVCMGTVAIDIKKTASLEDFTAAWEDYFFSSYFSHLMENHQPVLGNCVSLWKKLVNTGKAFPNDALIAANKTLKNLLK